MLGVEERPERKLSANSSGEFVWMLEEVLLGKENYPVNAADINSYNII